ncbi:MAG: hypothetical protein WDN28_17895 [Chthoniobacter sp.]
MVARVTGPVVAQIQAILLADYFIETGGTLDMDRFFPDLPPTGQTTAQMLPSGPGYQRENGAELFIALIYAARQRGVPDHALLRAR